MLLPPHDPNLVVIGLGGNLEGSKARILRARDSLAQQPELEAVAFSSLYRSRPMGPSDQPDYVNAVMTLRSKLSPLALLDCLQAIEQAEGRVRSGARWGARTLDLDLLLFGLQQINHPRLTVPHPGIVDREFVLYPLLEILPTCQVPGFGTIRELVRHCPRNGLEVLN